MGGGNATIFNALIYIYIQPDLFTGYGLDRENWKLLRQNKLVFALDHNPYKDFTMAYSILETRRNYDEGNTFQV